MVFCHIFLEEINEGDVFYAVNTYVSESEQSMTVVEGEKMYVIETANQDWWFVKKHLTEEKGWVPNQNLMDENTYMEYVKNTLKEKIAKLPIFESKYFTI